MFVYLKYDYNAMDFGRTGFSTGVDGDYTDSYIVCFPSGERLVAVEAYDTAEEAADRVHYLNGGQNNDERAKAFPIPDEIIKRVWHLNLTHNKESGWYASVFMGQKQIEHPGFCNTHTEALEALQKAIERET